MAGQSFIDIYRSMLKMEWEKDISVHCLYHHFLLHANMYPISFKSFEIPAGGMLVQLDQLAKDTGLTQNQVRLALKKLTDSHKITITVLHRVGSLVTIADWEAYTNETTLKPQQNHTKTTAKSESQDTENNEDTNQTDVQTTLKPQQNHTKTTTKEEQENKETSPTPLKENKEKEECLIKEKIQKKEKETQYPFQAFWDRYDKKIDKPKCEALWAKLSEADRKACIEYLPAYVASTSGERKQYRRHPATFLRNRSWENELPVIYPQQQLLFPPQETPIQKALREADNY